MKYSECGWDGAPLYESDREALSDLNPENLREWILTQQSELLCDTGLLGWRDSPLGKFVRENKPRRWSEEEATDHFVEVLRGADELLFEVLNHGTAKTYGELKFLLDVIELNNDINNGEAS
jgi:hypothetical protein